jgi:hypothetical protein
MRYVLLIYGDPAYYGQMTEEDQQADLREWFRYTDELEQAGATEGGAALQPTTTATTVRDDGGKPLVTDGPFAETREQLGGYYVLDVENLDEAIKWAHRCPGAKHGKIELRPIMELNRD